MGVKQRHCNHSLLQAVQRNDSMPNGRIHNWWTTFDTLYMQPVFGGAPHHSTQPVVELHRRDSRAGDTPRERQ